MATITKTRIASQPMKAFFAKRRGEEIEMVDAWIVEGRTTQRPYDIETRDYERALQYAALIDADDHDGVEALMRSAQTR